MIDPELMNKINAHVGIVHVHILETSSVLLVEIVDEVAYVIGASDYSYEDEDNLKFILNIERIKVDIVDKQDLEFYRSFALSRDSDGFYEHVIQCEKKFKFKCPNDWYAMDETNNARIRHCQECDKDVYFCVDAAEILKAKTEGLCVGFVEKDEEGSDITLGLLQPD